MHNCKIPSHARSIPPVPLFALAHPLPSSFLTVQNTTLKRDLNTSTTNNIIEEKEARIQERETWNFLCSSAIRQASSAKAI